ncbi:hypothetical protein N7468_009881 [Penicillium chermesinum]|uniref:Uncharacterized protein n=1 Tax=Penicillium chermesinum TaxID=63820 RepID=A0A9W9TBQ8_9EURO|nr:uncharacterized protein N7468_009881 [Penicillium chermesinum]KAJ5216873.1 hypothetical protein N7468_009881 [Penicillium chermesinum]
MHNAKSLRRGSPIGGEGGGGAVPDRSVQRSQDKQCPASRSTSPLPPRVPNEYLSPIDRAQSGQADLVMRAEYEIEARGPASLPADQYVPGLCPSGFGPGKG